MQDGDENASRVIREQEAAAGLRGNYESVWEQIAARIYTQYVTTFSSRNLHQSPFQGQQFTSENVDATGALALTRFASAMQSMNTPYGSKWHSLEPSDDALMKDRQTRLWMEEGARLLFKFRYAPHANYGSQKFEDYMSIGAFGTGTIFTDALSYRGERGLRYRTIPLGQNYFMENHQGMIDKNYRRFPLTARQAVQQFGRETLPEEIIKPMAQPQGDEKIHWFIHKVTPRDDSQYDPERKDVNGMPWYSCYVSVTGKKTLSESGYFTFPYAVNRYITSPGAIYGTSPAMLALPSIKLSNEIKKTLLKQGHRAVDPVLLTHDDGVLDGFSIKPGFVNSGGVTADGKLLVHALPTGDVSIGKDQQEEEKRIINDFFLVSLFQILVDNPQMTATEVVERAREKGALLSPTVGQQQVALGSQIERELDLLTQMKLLPPMPPALLEAQGQYTIRYDSPLSRMARAEEVSGLMRTVDYLKEVVAVTQDPSPLDHFDWDTIVPDMSDLQAVPAKWRRSMQTVKEIRQGRAEQAEEQQAVQAAPALSNMAKTMMPKPQAAPI